MKTLFIVVGKTIDKRLSTLTDEYVERVKHYVPFETVVIPELKNTKALTPELQKEREGELILKQLREGDHVVLLDEGGREFRSIDWASYLDGKLFRAGRRLVFVVGGPYGFSEAV